MNITFSIFFICDRDQNTRYYFNYCLDSSSYVVSIYRKNQEKKERKKRTKNKMVYSLNMCSVNRADSNGHIMMGIVTVVALYYSGSQWSKLYYNSPVAITREKKALKKKNLNLKNLGLFSIIDI